MSMNEKILKDKSFQKFLEKEQTLSKKTITNYQIAATHFANSNNSDFHTLVKTVFNEQRAKIVGNEIIPYDPD